ncbi:TPA: hypothetical protein DCW38_06690 [candidate division WOR-3 bacterium]|jgi:ubiquinone/menaquinone biosynthesis C-methylase UbiE|uniref:Methyltransferase domain-containing protein n=1 Tax=candidate division WOR-3 bacterium TaxID=2052148 RepID=A0A350HBD4_UNCW3|nr:hypothetical protein [candidate division WOR-3 bacterium]
MNYEESIWAEIYDSYNQGRHQSELEFYKNECRKTKGKCLEIATGTGMILLPLLEERIDITGFDISEQMLSILKEKAKAKGIIDIDKTVSIQDMVSFEYDTHFDLIFIPARSFLHLVRQEDQIQTLRNIKNHLKKDGRLLLNFFSPNYSAILRMTEPSEEWHHNGDYKKFSDGGLVRLFHRQQNDTISQIQNIEWKFIDGERETLSDMKVKWIFKEEFQLLLKTAGFSKWNLYGDFKKGPFTPNSSEMVWEAFV